MDIHIANWNYNHINSNLGKLRRKGERTSFQFWMHPVSKFCFPIFIPYISFIFLQQPLAAGQNLYFCNLLHKIPCQRERRTRCISGMWSHSNVQIQHMYSKRQMGWKRADAQFTQQFQVVTDVRQPPEVWAYEQDSWISSLGNTHCVQGMAAPAPQGWSRWEGTLPNT